MPEEPKFFFDMETLPECTCRPSARPEDGSHLEGCPDA